MKKNEKQVLIMLDSGSNGGRNLLPPIIINLFWSILSFPSWREYTRCESAMLCCLLRQRGESFPQPSLRRTQKCFGWQQETRENRKHPAAGSLVRRPVAITGKRYHMWKEREWQLNGHGHYLHTTLWEANITHGVLYIYDGPSSFHLQFIIMRRASAIVDEC